MNTFPDWIRNFECVWKCLILKEGFGCQIANGEWGRCGSEPASLCTFLYRQGNEPDEISRSMQPPPADTSGGLAAYLRHPRAIPLVMFNPRHSFVIFGDLGGLNIIYSAGFAGSCGSSETNPKIEHFQASTNYNLLSLLDFQPLVIITELILMR